MHPTETIDRDSLRSTTSPTSAAGDTVKVHVQVVEGNRERVQVFQGAVMRRQGGGVQGDVHRPQGELRRRGRADLPGALADDRQDRGHHAGRRAAGQAVLPAGAAREGGQDQGAARVPRGPGPRKRRRRLRPPSTRRRLPSRAPTRSRSWTSHARRRRGSERSTTRRPLDGRGGGRGRAWLRSTIGRGGRSERRGERRGCRGGR